MVEFQRQLDAEHDIRIRPNRSLSDRQIFWIVGAISFGCVSIAGLLALGGFWVPLPFAGAEVTALAVATMWVRRRLRRVETISVSPDEFEITRSGGKGHQRRVLPTGWVRIELREGRHRGYPKRLIVSGQGREYEIGACLVDSERAALADRLKELVRPHSMWAMP